MKLIALSLPLGDEGHTSLEVAGTFSTEERALLSQFVELVSRVRQSMLLSRGMPSISSVNWEMSSGIAFTCDEYTNAELHELLHVLRPVLLDEERASFHRVTALLRRRIPDPRVRAFLKLQNRVFRHGEMNLYMQITVGTQRLFDESLLSVWLNGTQYHTDEEKARAWRDLESTLKESSSRALVMTQLHGKVLTLCNVDYVARQSLSVENYA